VTTERRSRFAIALSRLSVCVLGAGLACGVARADAHVPAYPAPGIGSGLPQLAPAKAPPVIARVLAVSFQDGKAIITIAAGANSGVARGWTAQLLRGNSEDPLPGGDITIVRVDKAITVGRVNATPDQLRSYPRVKLSPP
jgi:hypothetical protein